MNNLKAYLKSVKETDAFIEDYKRRESATLNPIAERVTYKKISYRYKGRLYHRYVVLDYIKGDQK